MKQLLILVCFSLFNLTAKAAVGNLSDANTKGYAQMMELLVKDYRQSLIRQHEALKVVAASKKYEGSVKKRAMQVLPTVTGAINALSTYKKKYNIEQMNAAELKKVARSLLGRAHNAMQQADGVIVIVIDGGGIDDGGDDDDDKPDCSGAFNNIKSACAQGVSTKMRCGFYGANGGAAAVEQALEKCTMDANAAVASCESGSQTNTSGQESGYESDALLVCSQFEQDGLEPNAGQAVTPTGN